MTMADLRKNLERTVIAQRVQQVFLLLHAEILENFGGQVVRQNAHEDRFIVRAQVGKNLGNIRRGETAEYLAELIEIPLPNQFDQFRFKQAADHSRGIKSRRTANAKKQSL